MQFLKASTAYQYTVINSLHFAKTFPNKTQVTHG